ncbi:ABC transporter permease [Ureaplasma ceti]|uniref:ABC transporter permease n=1 Tax=Ureaplasma ceti TaxID=3119530 RepID=A0ABP9U874_9BACT
MGFLKLRSKLAWDSFIYTKSRKSATKNIISVVIAITLSVLAALLIAIAVGYNPGTILQQLFTKGFIDWHKLIFNIVILGVGALAFSFAFRAGVFNIGIAGQMMTAGICILVISRALSKVYFPYGSGQVFMTLIAVVIGAFVAGAVAALKVYLKVNEVISSILLNWIVFFAVRLIISKFYSDPNQLLSQSYDIPEQFRLVAPGIGGWLPALILLLILAGGMFVIIKYTVFGHKVISVGSSLTASKYAGYNVNGINIATMAISGGIAGILGYILYTAGESPSIPISMSMNALPVAGMNGIAIGLIAMSNPIAILPVSFIIGLFQSSAPFLVTPPAFSSLILGFVILGAALFVILTRYKPWLWIKQKLYGFYAPKHYQSFENGMESLISKYKALISEKTREMRNNAKLIKQGNAEVEPINVSKEANDMFNSYMTDRVATVAQYKKHLLVTKATQIFFPEVEAQNVVNEKNHAYDVQFINFKSKQANNIRKYEEKLASSDLTEAQRTQYLTKIDKISQSIDKNYELLLKWKGKKEKIVTSWYLAKLRMSGSIEKHRDHFLKQAQKLNLNSDEKALVIEWINDSYLEAKESSSKGVTK